MIRILHSVSNMDRAGAETMLMNYYRHINREHIQFDFITYSLSSYGRLFQKYTSHNLLY